MDSPIVKYTEQSGKEKTRKSRMARNMLLTLVGVFAVSIGGGTIQLYRTMEKKANEMAKHFKFNPRPSIFYEENIKSEEYAQYDEFDRLTIKYSNYEMVMIDGINEIDVRNEYFMNSRLEEVTIKTYKDSVSTTYYSSNINDYTQEGIMMKEFFNFRDHEYNFERRRYADENMHLFPPIYPEEKKEGNKQDNVLAKYDGKIKF